MVAGCRTVVWNMKKLAKSQFRKSMRVHIYSCGSVQKGSKCLKMISFPRIPLVVARARRSKSCPREGKRSTADQGSRKSRLFMGKAVYWHVYFYNAVEIHSPKPAHLSFIQFLSKNNGFCVKIWTLWMSETVFFFSTYVSLAATTRGEWGRKKFSEVRWIESSSVFLPKFANFRGRQMWK